MSKADVERFVGDLKNNADLLAEVKSKASGVGSVVEIARSHGYEITIAEAKDYIQKQTSSDLSDEQLDAVAGGKGGGSAAVQTNAVQTAEAATTVVEAAETVTSAVQDAEAATTVVAVAEAAIVAT